MPSRTIINGDESLSPSPATPTRQNAQSMSAKRTPSTPSKRAADESPEPLEATAPPSAPTGGSRSPYRVVSDLVDATCHEILNLGGSDPGTLAPSSSYDVLVERLNYYTEQLGRLREEKDEDGQEERSTLSVGGIWHRLLMSQMALDVCSRSAYPNMHQPRQQQSNLPALIDMPASQWIKLRKQLEKLRGTVPRDSRMNPPLESAVESVNCQMEAMEALAKLRHHLNAVVTEMDPDAFPKLTVDVDTPASHFSNASVYLDEYKTSTSVIIGRLHNIGLAGYGGLFVPEQMLLIDSRRKEALTSLIDEVKARIARKTFPVQHFQLEFLNLLKDWEKTHLPPPALFEAGYFKSGGQSAARPLAAGESTPVSPVTPAALPRKHRQAEARNYKDAESSNDGDSTSSEPRSAAKRQGKATSQSSLGGSIGGSSMTSKSRARKKRVPYTEEEKSALAKGIQMFAGQHSQWNKILDHFDDIFRENRRTNVNLKDLYRTMKQKGEI